MKIDIIDQQSYEIGYAAGLVDGYDDAYKSGYQRCMRDERRRKEREMYYILQKALGSIMLAVTVLCIIVLDGDATIALLLLPIILCLIFSNRPMLVMKGKRYDNNL